MQMIENPMIMNIPDNDIPDDIDVCTECGEASDLFFITDKDGEFKGCRSCVTLIDAWDSMACPACGSRTCLTMYWSEEGAFGCDECVSTIEPVDWYWRKINV